VTTIPHYEHDDVVIPPFRSDGHPFVEARSPNTREGKPPSGGAPAGAS